MAVSAMASLHLSRIALVSRDLAELPRISGFPATVRAMLSVLN